jgi:hypothetical protein
MTTNRGVNMLLTTLGVAVGVGVTVALWGVLIGEFGFLGLVVGLFVVYVAQWRVLAWNKARREKKRAALQADIDAARARLDQDPLG